MVKTNSATVVNMPGGGTRTVQDVLVIAIELHQSGKIRQAAELYRRILEVTPQHADALHLLGLTARQQNNFTEAMDLIGRAISIRRNALYFSNLSECCLATGRLEEGRKAGEEALRLDLGIPEAYLNLGHISLALGNHTDAIRYFNKVLELRPDHTQAVIGLGDSLVASGQLERGLETFRKLMVTVPDDLAALTRVGITLRKMGRVDEAIEHYRTAIERVPTSPELYNNLSLLYQSRKQMTEASECLQKLLEITPDDEAARHMLNALTGKTSSSAPVEYVRDVFDGYANTFESHLVSRLDYRVPGILAAEIRSCMGDRTGLRALDLGCGTGLFAEHIHDVYESITGIDISPKMVERARAKNLYTSAEVADILEYLCESETASYDLVAASDVFVYIGDLENIFAESRRILASGGYFAFSVETNTVSDGYILNDTGRYSHSKSYLAQLSKKCGFKQMHLSDARLRNQEDRPVNGYLCIYQA